MIMPCLSAQYGPLGLYLYIRLWLFRDEAWRYDMIHCEVFNKRPEDGLVSIRVRTDNRTSELEPRGWSYRPSIHSIDSF